MIPLSIKTLSQIVDGKLVAIADEQQILDSISIDSRQIDHDGLFIALIGEFFDGHAFVAKAIEKGAKAALVSHQIDEVTPQIIVKDTHKALGQIAAWVRQQSKAKIVALTGSSGKTSVKEMTAAILANYGNTLYTQGNFNNDIGVPLTLLRLSEQNEFAVIELGANHIGEIAYTTHLVKPQSALINNISAAHLEGFGSIEGVAQAKSEIFAGLPNNGIAIINLDNYSKSWMSKLQGKTVYTFSVTEVADFYATEIKQQQYTQFILHTPQGECEIILPLLGMHNVSNALAAAALSMSVGADLASIKRGLNTVNPVKGRLYPIKLNDDQIIFDDTYNANAGSMKAAIDVLSTQRGYRVFVVGDMGELGPDSDMYHCQIGKEVKKSAIDCVVSVGNRSRLISQHSGIGHHFTSKEDAKQFLVNLLKDKQIVTMLVKGSRSAKMEELIEQFRNNQD